MNIVSLYLYGSDILSTVDGFFVFFTVAMFIFTCGLILVSLCGEKVDIKAYGWYDVKNEKIVSEYSEIPYDERRDKTKWLRISASTEEYKRFFPWIVKWTWLTIPLFILSLLVNLIIPEKNTMLLIATSQTAEYVSTTPIGADAVGLMNDTLKLLKKKITEELGTD